MERVLGAMDNDTILFVTGDHGMRDDGNHGGSS
jgi:arylsulfatase A-like enzyme